MTCPNHPQWIHGSEDCPICSDKCNCEIRDREEHEEQRDWFKRCMCMFHWMQTDYYKNKLHDMPNPRQELK
jgi:hypothetical protein